MIAWLAAALAAATGAQPAPAGTPGRWTLRADPALCVLERQDAEPAVTLSIGTVPGTDAYRIAIAAADIGKPASFTPASLAFGATGPMRDVRANVVKLPDGRQLIWFDGLDPAALGDLAAAETVTITTKSRARGTAAMPTAAKAVAALRRCTADQLTEWGADPLQFAPGGRMPVAVKQRDDWLPTKDLLEIAGRAKQSDIDLLFRVGISEAGTVDDCHAVATTDPKDAETIACAAVLNRQLFTPARSAAGDPVRGVATFRIVLASRPSR